MTFTKQIMDLAIQKGYSCDEQGNVYGPKGNKLAAPANKGRRYFTVRIDEIDNTRRTFTLPVHKFIAYHFFGNKAFEKDIVVRHLDNDSLNDKLDNLKLGSRSDNMMDIPEQKRISHAKRAASFLRKFTDEQEIEIQEFHKKTKSYAKTMEKFGVNNKATLHYILKKNIARSSIG